MLRRCWLCWMALVCMCLFLVDFVGFLLNIFVYCDEVVGSVERREGMWGFDRLVWYNRMILYVEW